MAKDRVTYRTSGGVKTTRSTSDNIEDWTTLSDAVTVAKAVYIDANDRIAHADANVFPALALAFEGVDSTNVRAQTWGLQEGVLSGATFNMPYYLSEAAGELTTAEPTTSGAYSQVLGRAVNATDLMVSPEVVPRRHVAQPSAAAPKAVYWEGSGAFYEVAPAVVVPKAWSTWPGVALAPSTTFNSNVIVTLAANLGSDHGQPDRGDPQLSVFSQEAPVIHGPYTADGANTSSTKLHSGAAAFAAQAHKNRRVRITDGTGVGQERHIRVDHAEDTARVTEAFSPVPDATSTFEIYEDRAIRFWHDGEDGHITAAYGGVVLTGEAVSVLQVGAGELSNSGQLRVASGQSGYTASMGIGLGGVGTYSSSFDFRTTPSWAEIHARFGSNSGRALVITKWSTNHGHSDYVYPTTVWHGVDPATDNTGYLGVQFNGGSTLGRIFTGKGGLSLEPYDNITKVNGCLQVAAFTGATATGQLRLNGTALEFYNGTAWKVVTFDA